MNRFGHIFCALGALAAASYASGAAAQTRSQTAPARAANASDAYTLNESQEPQVLELDGSRRWGLKLEVRQPVTRPTELKDVEAGAFYKLTPTLRLGGALGVTDAAAPTADQPTPAQTTPRVRLNAIFKF